MLQGPAIDAAYQATSREAITGVIERYERNFSISIEAFADLVRGYIDRQGKDFRLNFLVDEVGQYVANSPKLMTNLQTIAESLATRCNRRAWIAVTAQEELDSVIGDMTKGEKTDFSKIQDRFRLRFKLTSVNVGEVIKVRLLAKTDAAQKLLHDLYVQHNSHFGTLFSFPDGGRQYQGYAGEKDFIATYPFAPYQAPLFQSAIQGLSSNEAFEGRHAAVGERSMLVVFQQVAQGISQKEIGQLATFDQMFEGIRSALKSQFQTSVLTAEQHFGNPFAVRVLKTLFLVKYVKDFRATPKNLTVLLQEDFTPNFGALLEQVTEALNLLEQQTYIQREGNQYAYLTKPEKDVEAAIKDVAITQDEQSKQLQEWLFESVLRANTLATDGDHFKFGFTRRLDGRTYSQTRELSIHIITPLHEHSGNLQILQGQNQGAHELTAILPPDDRLLRDLRLFLQTARYVRNNDATQQSESKTLLIQAKAAQNARREEELKARCGALLGEATLLVNGSILELPPGDARTRIARAGQKLIEITYLYLPYLANGAYHANQVKPTLNDHQGHLLRTGDALPTAEIEILNKIKFNQSNGVRTTLKSLAEVMETRPYGWPLAALQVLVARLCARGRLELRRNGVLLEGNALESAIVTSPTFDQVALSLVEEFSSSQIQALRTFHQHYFATSSLPSEAKALATATATELAALHETLATWQGQQRQYPFLADLAAPLQRLAGVCAKPYTFYLTEFAAFQDELQDDRTDTVNPIIEFMNGEGRRIYDAAAAYLREQTPNLAYVTTNGRNLEALLVQKGVYRGAAATQIKNQHEHLRKLVGDTLAKERSDAVAAIERLWLQLTAADEFGQISPDDQATLRQPFAEKQDYLRRQTVIGNLREETRQFEQLQYGEALATLLHLATPPPPLPPVPPPPSPDGDENSAPSPTPPPAAVAPAVAPVVVRLASLPVDFGRPWLQTEGDVDDYLALWAKALKDAIAVGKNILLP